METSTDRATLVTSGTLFGVSLLVGSLFFEWLEVPYRAADTTLSLDGWTALETGDAVFVMIALVAAGLAYFRGLRGPWPLLLALAAAAIVVTFAVSTTPGIEIADAISEGTGDPYDFGPGLFIAALGALLLLVVGLVEARGHTRSRDPG